VVLDRVRVENVSASGILFDSETTIGTINGTVRDSLSAGSNRGISVSEGGSGITRIVVERSAAVNNTFGLLVFGTGATVRIGDSNVSGNGTGLSAVSGGAIASYQTNKIDGNGTDGSPTSTITMK